ncbi:unnamed protein product, partial [Oncorhynchus mykiss]
SSYNSVLSLVQLFDLVYREETLLNVIKSVTRNGRSIVLTAVLALILVYLFSIVGYIFFKDDFILEVDRIPNTTLENGVSMPNKLVSDGMCQSESGENNCTTELQVDDLLDDMEDGKERTCDSLLMCIVTVLSHGLRSGGGVGDVLRKPSKEVSTQTRPPPSTLWREHKVSQCKTADLATVQLFKS